MGGALNCTDSELCTFLQVLAEGFLPTCCSDTGQSVPLSGMSIASRSYRKGKKTVSFHGFQYLQMYRNSMEPLGADSSILCAEVSLARTSAAQDGEAESRGQGQACGGIWLESLAKYDRATHSWKTVPCSLLGDSVSFSPTWPRWGMMRDGVAYRQEALAQTTRGTGSGSLLPTPTCHNAKEGAYPAEYTRKTPTLATHVGGKIHPNFTEWMMVWPRDWTDLKPLETGSAHWQRHALLRY